MVLQSHEQESIAVRIKSQHRSPEWKDDAHNPFLWHMDEYIVKGGLKVSYINELFWCCAS